MMLSTPRKTLVSFFSSKTNLQSIPDKSDLLTTPPKMSAVLEYCCSEGSLQGWTGVGWEWSWKSWWSPGVLENEKGLISLLENHKSILKVSKEHETIIATLRENLSAAEINKELFSKGFVLSHLIKTMSLTNQKH